LFGVTAALGLTEAALRAFWCGRIADYEYQSGPYLCANRYWGAWHFPNNAIEHRQACFDSTYHTNSLGMRGSEFSASARKIALLGDSFVEGFANNDDSTISNLMQHSLQPSYEVLNFGVSGGFSTVDEVVVYDDFARIFHPDVAILFFVNYNDLQENLEHASRFLDRNLNFIYTRPTKPEDVIAHLCEQKLSSVVERPDRALCLVRLVRLAFRTMRFRLQMLLHLRLDLDRELARPYIPNEDPEISRAWKIVEISLARLNEIAKRDSTKLVIVDIADPYQVDANWLRLASARNGVALDATRPNRRLGEICSKLGISYLDLYPETMKFIEANHLGFPYLSYSCNRHFSPAGNRLTSDLVVKYLRDEHLVGP
jgi:hypothetical protein